MPELHFSAVKSLANTVTCLTPLSYIGWEKNNCRIPCFFAVGRTRFRFISFYTNKKEKKICLIFKKVQKGAVAKSNRRKGFLIYEEMCKYLVIYEEAISHISLLNFLI
jgi:hypothetical protein